MLIDAIASRLRAGHTQKQTAAALGISQGKLQRMIRWRPDIPRRKQKPKPEPFVPRALAVALARSHEIDHALRSLQENESITIRTLGPDAYSVNGIEYDGRQLVIRATRLAERPKRYGNVANASDP